MKQIQIVFLLISFVSTTLLTSSLFLQKYRLQSTSYRLLLINNLDEYYSIDCYIGDNNHDVELIIGTAVDWVVAFSSQCSTCKGYVTSQYQSQSVVSYYSKTLSYGSTSFRGLYFSDDIKMGSSGPKVLDITYLFVLETNGLPPYSGGLLGFSRSSFAYVDGGYITDIFYKKLSSRIFTLLLNDSPTDSYIEIGTSDISTYSSDSTQAVEWTQTDDAFWGAYIEGFKIGTKYQYQLISSQFMIINSSEFLFIMPYFIGTAIINMILEGIEYSFLHNKFIVPCDTSLYQSFYLYIDGHWIEIPPQSYIVTFSSLCYLGLVAEDTYYWKAGTLFIKNYYMIFDTNSNKITVAPKVGGTVTKIPNGTIPNGIYLFINDPTLYNLGNLIYQEKKWEVYSFMKKISPY